MSSTGPDAFETGLSAFQGHRLSNVPGMPGEVSQTLAELGITDAEQFVAIASLKDVRSALSKHLKISAKDLDSFVNEAEKAIPSRLVTELETPAEADLSLGALRPSEEMLAEMLAIPVVVDEEVVSLPPAVNYRDQMLPVRNQGGRGTCVAFALAAVHEFHRRKRNEAQEFSEQHLYFETKLIDGYSGCGTWQREAVKVLQNRGQCRESVWPYNPNPPCNSHGVMPANARTDASSFRVSARALNPRDIRGIKAVLASGSLVGFSIPVFNSWYLSAETRRTGRINMPIGSESSQGGHAMCFIGYQDDGSAPGGGYFILRNSWGTGWGHQSPYGAGNGTIPYAYIAQHNWEAYTIIDHPLINVNYDLKVEFLGQGAECYIRFPFFRINNLHPNRAVRINRLLIKSYHGNNVIDEFNLNLDPGGILEPGQVDKEILLEGLLMKAHGNRQSWSYRVTWHYWFTWWQRATAVSETGDTAAEPIEVSGEIKSSEREQDVEPDDRKTGARNINISVDGDITINIR